MKKLAEALETPVEKLFPDIHDIEKVINLEHQFKKKVLSRISENDKQKLLKANVVDDPEKVRKLLLQFANKYKIVVPPSYKLRKVKK